MVGARESSASGSPGSLVLPASPGSPASPVSSSSPASQTLSRGIRVLEELASTRDPLSIDDLARALDVHRSIAYRLVRTLEDHRLVARDASGRVALAPRMAVLAAGVDADLQAAARPELAALADDLGMTAFVAVLDVAVLGVAECVTLVSVEPRHAIASVAQRPGARHPITVGAPSKAILATIPESAWPTGIDGPLRAEIAEAAERGYATSHDEVIPTVAAVSVPLRLGAAHRPAAIAVISAGGLDAEAAASRMRGAADAIRRALEG